MCSWEYAKSNCLHSHSWADIITTSTFDPKYILRGGFIMHTKTKTYSRRGIRFLTFLVLSKARCVAPCGGLDTDKWMEDHHHSNGFSYLQKDQGRFAQCVWVNRKLLTAPSRTDDPGWLAGWLSVHWIRSLFDMFCDHWQSRIRFLSSSSLLIVLIVIANCLSSPHLQCFRCPAVISYCCFC